MFSDTIDAELISEILNGVAGETYRRGPIWADHCFCACKMLCFVVKYSYNKDRKKI